MNDGVQYQVKYIFQENACQIFIAYCYEGIVKDLETVQQ
jgi:hypothetical protein